LFRTGSAKSTRTSACERVCPGSVVRGGVEHPGSNAPTTTTLKKMMDVRMRDAA